MSTRRFEPYPAYKDSGVEWLGEIPAHWEIKRLRHATSKIGSGKTPSGGAEVYVPEGVMLLRSQNVHFAGLRLDDVAFIDADTDADMAGSRVQQDDVLLNITGASLGRCCLAHLDGRAANVNQHVCVIRPNPGEFVAAFLAAAIASQPGQAQIFNTENGISRDALNFSQIGDLSLGRAPLEEQRAIAAFLDRETARIDGLVAKKERLIELLQEKRTALITRAVTEGLDPNVPMKDSGLEWLGEIPAHWACLSLARVTLSRCDGPFGSGLKSAHYVTDGVRVIRLQNIGCAEFVDEDRAYISEAYSQELGDHSVTARDLLIAGLGDEGHPVGRACVAPDGIEPAIVKADCFRFRMDRRRIVPRYAAYQLSVTATAASSLATGATRARMNLTVTATRKVALPPLEEQRAIVDALDLEGERHVALVAKVREAIERLKELRTALISDAVTGKIDVRAASAEASANPGESA